MKNDLFKNCYAVVDYIFYSPYYKDSQISLYSQNQNDRKPNNGLFLKAIKKWNVDINNSFCIGDKLTYKIASEKTIIKFFS